MNFYNTKILTFISFIIFSSTLTSQIVDIETLKNICASNNLDFSIIENQIKTELHWNSLIFELYLQIM